MCSVSSLMGPTGAGKSAFIESLSPDQNLEISKDSLESVTKEVVCYQVVNLTYGSWAEVLLMDTPGFLDTKLSESQITLKIADMLEGLQVPILNGASCIFYFQPITDIQIGGSKREAVKLLRAFAETIGATDIKVATTMWNHTSTPKQVEDANRRFDSLKNEIFMETNRLGIKVVKFEFSSDSALQMLDGFGYPSLYAIDTSQLIDPHYQSLIVNNLVDRITNTQLWLQILAEDKQAATTPGREDPLLLEVVLRDKKVALAVLQLLLDDLQLFLDDMYKKDAQSCLSLFPRRDINQSLPAPPSLSPPSPLPLSPSPLPSPYNKKSMSAHIKTMTSSIEKIFKKL
ncbi:hypothetical protein BJ165DRAFT_1408171 [Panaeolus papilionaceus]|nr:hypothetical protein BJ165DRAFT_1408171 [Panaeolus papilionaceus]